MTDTTTHIAEVARAVEMHLRPGMTIAVDSRPTRRLSAVVPLTPDEWREAMLSTYEGTSRVPDA
jgi:hypothetical protein